MWANNAFSSPLNVDKEISFSRTIEIRTHTKKSTKAPSVWNANVYAFTQLFRDKERWQHMAAKEKNHMNNWHFSNPHIYVT